jgi:hypothetical protein
MTPEPPITMKNKAIARGPGLGLRLNASNLILVAHGGETLTLRRGETPGELRIDGPWSFAVSTARHGVIFVRHATELLRIEPGDRNGAMRLVGPGSFRISRHRRPECGPGRGIACES